MLPPCCRCASLETAVGVCYWCGCLLLVWVSAMSRRMFLVVLDFCRSSAACSPCSNLPAYHLLLLRRNLCPACSRASFQSDTSITGETTSSITHSHGSLSVFVWGGAPEYPNCCVQKRWQLRLALSAQQELPIPGTGVGTTTVHTLRTSLLSQ